MINVVVTAKLPWDEDFWPLRKALSFAIGIEISAFVMHMRAEI
jgi:hypothetical protein